MKKMNEKNEKVKKLPKPFQYNFPKTYLSILFMAARLNFLGDGFC